MMMAPESGKKSNGDLGGANSGLTAMPPGDRRRTNRGYAAKAERRFVLILVGVVMALVIGGVHTSIQVNGVTSIAEQSRILNRKMHFFHQLDIAAQLVLSNRSDVFDLVAVADRLAEESGVREILPEQQLAVANLVEAALQNPEKYRSDVAQITGHIADLHETYDVLVRRASEEFDAGTRNVYISLVLTALVTVLLVAGPPWLFIRDMTSGIARLRMKVDMAELGGDPTAIDVERGDEIGDVAREFDRMYRAAQAREGEREISRQMVFEYQKLNDLISVAGGIAHEVGNPLASLVPQIDDLETRIEVWRSRIGAADNLDIENGFDEVRAALGRIETLLRRISAFAFDPSDGGEALDTNEVLRTSVEMIKLHDTTRLVSITQNLDVNLPLVHCSRPLLSMALFSVLGSLVRLFDDRPGELRLTTTAQPGQSCVELCFETVGEPPQDEAISEMETTTRVIANMLQATGGHVDLVRDQTSVRLSMTLPLDGEGSVRNTTLKTEGGG